MGYGVCREGEKCYESDMGKYQLEGNQKWGNMIMRVCALSTSMVSAISEHNGPLPEQTTNSDMGAGCAHPVLECPCTCTHGDFTH